MNTSDTRSSIPHLIILGTRGIPNVPGGVEKHVENLAPLIAEKGYQATVIARRPYVKEKKAYHYKGVTVLPTYCPKHKYLEALYHTFFGCFKARLIGADIIHIHACGPSLFTPLAKLLGFKVVITNHGPEYERQKWNAFAKGFLKFCEWVSMKSADRVITISDTIKTDLEEKYKRHDIVVIPNGVEIDGHGLGETDEYGSGGTRIDANGVLGRYNLEPGKYIIAVGRFVPEKGFHDLIEAWTRMNRGMGRGAWGMAQAELDAETRSDVEKKVVGVPHEARETMINDPDKECAPHEAHLQRERNHYTLVIVGDADHEDEYSRSLKERARKEANIVLTGFQTGAPLDVLFRHAALFVLPSYYEGLPITLLEAMSYGLSCIVSDIPANKNVRIDAARTFQPGDSEALSRLIARYLATPISDAEKQAQIEYIKENFDWKKIAAKTLRVYQAVRKK
jgi:glycosyltransferase involved in cell wall biosynthesis